MNEPYLDQAPIECPTCGSHDWTQTQDYQATDRHWLTWRPIKPDDVGRRYEFTYEQVATSDEDTGPWSCQNGHEADDETAELLAEVV